MAAPGLARGQRHRDLARLADIAREGGTAEHVSLGREAVARAGVPRLLRSGIQGRVHLRRIGRIQPRAQAARRMVFGVGDQQAEGAEHAGQRRHDHAA